jgi:hypothetical protein
MLYTVIARVSAETGISLTEQRDVLLNLWNAACRIFYAELEVNTMYQEVTLVVPPDKVCSLPYFIGEIKGIRIHSSELLVPLDTINVPRYTNSTVTYRIRNWRDLGDRAICCNLTTVAPLTLTCASIETTPVIVKISGQTDAAVKIEEEILVNATTVQSVNQFGPRIDSIACFSDRDNDIIVTDVNGTMIATLGNDQEKTRYKIIDVSQIFWPANDTTEGDSFIDVCYKVPFVLGKNDTDSFGGGDDYDEAIYHMMLHLNFMNQGGKDTLAAAQLVRAMQLLKAAKDGAEGGFHKKLNWGRNKFYGLFKRHRGSYLGNDYNVMDDGQIFP